MSAANPNRITPTASGLVTMTCALIRKSLPRCRQNIEQTSKLSAGATYRSKSRPIGRIRSNHRQEREYNATEAEIVQRREIDKAAKLAEKLRMEQTAAPSGRPRGFTGPVDYPKRTVH
jgi:hypothetical protein